jgi:formylglycine-generating enzyme required for sulfatase activity
MKNFYEIEKIAVPGNPEQGLSPFYLGKYPITQAQWRAIAGLPRIEIELDSDPAYFKGADLPVECVTYYEALEACARLSVLTGREHRLPTEKEWEHACLAGSTGEYCFGDDVKQLGDYAWFSENSERRTHPVGQKKPNVWGLYDMHGNVWEWCAEVDGHDYVPLRGGSWFDLPTLARAGFRDFDSPLVRYYYFGFRVVVGDRSSYGSLRGGSWCGGHGNARAGYRGFNVLLDYLNDVGFRVAVGERSPQMTKGEREGEREEEKKGEKKGEKKEENVEC